MNVLKILVWAPAVVGSVLLLTGLLKALSPTPFLQHIHRLKIIPPRIIRWAVPALIVFECGLGAALISGLWPAVIWPATIIVLLVLAALTWWSTSTGRVQDCGCYQGLVEISPAQSIGLTIAYAALIGLAWWQRPDLPANESFRWIAVLAVMLATAVLLWLSIRRVQSGLRPLVDFNPLKPGRRWNPSWLPQAPADLVEGEKLLVFLSTTCPHCKRWIKVLNLVHRRDDLPDAVGMLVAPMEQLAVFAFNEGTRFPVRSSQTNHVWATLSGVPTAVLLVDGVIQHRWRGGLDPDFMERIRPGISEKIAAHREHVMADLMKQVQAIEQETA